MITEEYLHQMDLEQQRFNRTSTTLEKLQAKEKLLLAQIQWSNANHHLQSISNTVTHIMNQDLDGEIDSDYKAAGAALLKLNDLEKHYLLHQLGYDIGQEQRIFKPDENGRTVFRQVTSPSDRIAYNKILDYIILQDKLADLRKQHDQVKAEIDQIYESDRASRELFGTDMPKGCSNMCK